MNLTMAVRCLFANEARVDFYREHGPSPMRNGMRLPPRPQSCWVTLYGETEAVEGPTLTAAVENALAAKERRKLLEHHSAGHSPH